MTDLFSRLEPAVADPAPVTTKGPSSAARAALPASSERPLTAGERACGLCSAAAVFFLGFGADSPAWCFRHAPADFFPGSSAP